MVLSEKTHNDIAVNLATVKYAVRVGRTSEIHFTDGTTISVKESIDVIEDLMTRGYTLRAKG